MTLRLRDEEQAMLAGDAGEASALAMRILTEVAASMGASELVAISSAHIDGCLYHGMAGLEFAERLVAGGAAVRVPTTLNVSSLDLLHPGLVRLEPDGPERRLMDAYVAMHARPTWTCAPYQLAQRPAFGEQIAWAESNAIVFANSVLGARTERYGDFIDACCAITGRAPLTGLHTDEGRLATVAFDVSGPPRLLATAYGFALVGLVVGRLAGGRVPAIEGLAGATEDQLKALGAAAASSGAVAMFHAVGSTPEAPTLTAATGGRRIARSAIGLPELRAAAEEFATHADGPIGAVCLGTPHASPRELERIAELLTSDAPPMVPVFVNAGRDVLDGASAALRAALAPATLVSDTCTYLTPVLHGIDAPVMTDSAKWAWYGPGNLGVDVVGGTIEECLRSASLGHVWRDPELWADA